MDFSGFLSSDFDFFKKKSLMDKTELDKNREEVKRHFREFCYEIQKIYYSSTGQTLLLDKNFHGLYKSGDYIFAKSSIDSLDLVNLRIELCRDSISIKLACPSDGDSSKFEMMKQKIKSRTDIFLKFFKENKSMYVALFKRNSKKTGDGDWKMEHKFDNSELVYGDFTVLLNNMNSLQSTPYDKKRLAGIHIGLEFSKGDATRIGKMLASRACSEIIKLLDLCQNISCNELN